MTLGVVWCWIGKPLPICFAALADGMVHSFVGRWHVISQWRFWVYGMMWFMDRKAFKHCVETVATCLMPQGLWTRMCWKYVIDPVRCFWSWKPRWFSVMVIDYSYWAWVTRCIIRQPVSTPAPPRTVEKRVTSKEDFISYWQLWHAYFEISYV